MMERKILVTGGNRGIGRAIVEEFSKDPKDLILLGTRELKEGVQVANQFGENVEAVELDLEDRIKLKRNVDALLKKYHRVDVLVNNAGVLNEQNCLEIDLQKWDESLRVNFLGPYELIRYLLPKMEENNYGRIINISSGWGAFSEGLSGPFAYSVTKASLNALTKSLAHHLPFNIKINSMCPGWVKTKMGGDSAPRTPQEGAQTAIWLGNLGEEGPTGKFFRDKKEIDW